MRWRGEVRGTHQGNERNIGIKSWFLSWFLEDREVGAKTHAASDEGGEEENP